MDEAEVQQRTRACNIILRARRIYTPAIVACLLLGLLSAICWAYGWVISGMGAQSQKTALMFLMPVFIATGFSLLVAAAAFLVAFLTISFRFMRFSLGHLVSVVLYFGLCVALLISLSGGLKTIPIAATSGGVILIAVYVMRHDPTRRLEEDAGE